jgi:hypothetical protein
VVGVALEGVGQQMLRSLSKQSAAQKKKIKPLDNNAPTLGRGDR